jgi:hypothetical protein
MLILKALGSIDLVSSLAFLLVIFGFDVQFQVILFCAGLLFLKGLFIFTGDVLSAIDLVSSAILVLSIFFALPLFLLWIPAFLLLSKGFVSFL